MSTPKLGCNVKLLALVKVKSSTLPSNKRALVDMVFESILEPGEYSRAWKKSLRLLLFVIFIQVLLSYYGLQRLKS